MTEQNAKFQTVSALGEDLRISEHQFFSGESLSAPKTQTEFKTYIILTVRRATDQTERFALDIDPINHGDTLIMLGPDKAHEEISPKLSKA